MNDLVRYENGVLVPVSGNGADSMATRPDVSVVPASRRRPGSQRRMAVAVIAAAVIAAVAVGTAAMAGTTHGGGSGGGGVPARSGAATGSLAASASASAHTTSVSFTLSAIGTSAGTTSTLLSGSGSVDLTKGVGQATATVPALSSLLGGASAPVTVVSDGSNLFVDVPGLTSVTGGRPWVEASVSSASSLLGGSTAGSLPLSALSDPSGLLSLLGSLGSPVTDVGTVQLDGAPATEYQTTVSASAVAAHLGSDSSGTTGRALSKALRQLGVASFPVSVWVGQDGLVRQVSLDIDLSHAHLGGLLGGAASSSSSVTGSSVALTVGFSNYGTPVSVQVPPSSQVTDLSAAGSSIQGALSQLGSTVSGLNSRV